MVKYDALGVFFREKSEEELVMTFRQVEKAMGNVLPGKAAKPQWWARKNPTTEHDQRWAWQPAGYSALLLAGRRVRFSRLSSS